MGDEGGRWWVMMGDIGVWRCPSLGPQCLLFVVWVRLWFGLPEVRTMSFIVMVGCSVRSRVSKRVIKTVSN